MYVNAERICISLLNTKCKTLRAATQIHALALKAGLDHSPLLAGKLLLRCAVAISGASLDHARRLLLNFPDPDSFMFNTLLRGFSGDPTRSLAVFKDMHRRNASLSDSFTFAFALKSVAASRRLSPGSQLHCRALVHGLGTHLFVATTLVSFYGECGALASARKVFDEMPQRNVVAWNAVLAACFGCGDVAGGEALFRAMPARDLTSWDILLAGYIRAGQVGSARETFVAMPARDDVSWGSMIAGLARSGLYEETFGLFNELRRAGLAPNEAGLTGALSAAAQAGAFHFGRSLHGFVEKAGLSSTVSVNNALLDAYAKSGHVGLAQKVFDAMPEKSIVSWSSMIAALAMHGLGEEAVRVFSRMESSGIRPDVVAFVSILYACSHAGLVDEGERCFMKMISDGEIEPEIEHYGCMVDLYARSGDLEKAYRFASQMPIPPNAVIWRTLLGACTFHGDVEMAMKAREKLSRLDPANPGDRVLLSNVYASNGKWNDAESMRRSMSGLGIKKTPGRSIVEVERLIYSFGAGDKGSGPADEARESLREVTTRLRVKGGYVTEVVGTVLHDVEEEDKEDSVTCHSEKLAVAFAMRMVREGVIIRVVKNLRICGDCHTFMKLVSKVYGLEIVVRDRSRFHSFKGGTCSCRDYW